jgi:hypothetical protein
MTKPDMLNEGSIKSTELWIDVIEGRRHTLKHSYYCVRQPDDPQRAGGITPNDARTSEIQYFGKIKPWANLGMETKQRLGTQNLASMLSALLVQIIKTTSVHLSSYLLNAKIKLLSISFCAMQCLTGFRNLLA